MNHGGNPEKTFLAIVTFTVGMTLFILYVCLLSGCSTGAKELAIARPSQAVLIKDVPFFPQLDYQCGPASLAGVLNYYGDTVTPDEIAEDMVLYARQRGFDSKWYEGNTDDIVRAVDSGSPLVVMIDLGFSLARAYHYMVITGYSSQGVIANTGTTSQKLISWERFMSQWERTHNWTLLVTPKKAVLSSRQN
jgi:ABC-type bacteriocin/lantibiotic exporter with double-glycine peptidase domain